MFAVIEGCDRLNDWQAADCSKCSEAIGFPAVNLKLVLFHLLIFALIKRFCKEQFFSIK